MFQVWKVFELTGFGSLFLSSVDQQVSRAFGAEGKQQVLGQSWDQRQGQHHGPAVLGAQNGLKADHLQKTMQGDDDWLQQMRVSHKSNWLRGPHHPHQGARGQGDLVECGEGSSQLGGRHFLDVERVQAHDQTTEQAEHQPSQDQNLKGLAGFGNKHKTSRCHRKAVHY